MIQPEEVGDHRVALTQAEKHQVAQVQQRAEQHQPEHSQLTQAAQLPAQLDTGAKQQPHLMRSRLTQAEEHQAARLPAQLGEG